MTSYKTECVYAINTTARLLNQIN